MENPTMTLSLRAQGIYDASPEDFDRLVEYSKTLAPSLFISIVENHTTSKSLSTKSSEETTSATR